MNKYSIKYNRKQPSSKEINSRKNFRQVLQQSGASTSLKNTLKFKLWLSSVIIGLAGISSYFIITKEAAPLSSNKSFIQAPYPTLDPVYESYHTVNASADTIHTLYGSTLYIPQNCFPSTMDSITIHYRDFVSPLEFALSGIPMTYDSAEIQYTFESGGMFELYFTHNNQAVEPQKDKSITIDFNATTNDPSFNFYQLDTLERNWKYLSKANNISPQEQNSSPMVYRPGTVEKQELIPLRRRIREAEQQIETHTLKAPLLPSQPNKNRYRFHLDLLAEEFPELAHYNDLQFEIRKAYQTYDAAIFKTEWTDIKLKHLKKDRYLLSLFKKRDKHDFIVTPVYEGKAYDSIKNIYQKAHQQYLSEEKRLKEEKRNFEKRFQKVKAKAIEDGERYQKEQLARQAVIDSNNKETTAFIQRYTIIESGIYNCDKARTLANVTNIPIRIIDHNNRPLPTSFVYMAQDSRNSIFDISSMIFPYNKKRDYFIFAVDKEGNMGYIAKESYKNVSKNNNKKIHFLKFMPLHTNQLTPEYFNELAGFNVMRQRKI